MGIYKILSVSDQCEKNDRPVSWSECIAESRGKRDFTVQWTLTLSEGTA